METRYDLLFQGQIAPNFSSEVAKRNLAKLLRREPAEIESLFSGKPHFLRRGLEADAAYRYQGTMKHAGLVCRLVPSDEIAPAAPSPPPAVTSGPTLLDKKPDTPRPASTLLDKKPARSTLTLESLSDDSSRATEPASAESPNVSPTLTECPKCRYHARGPQDGLISQGVCPACGLIIAKYLQLQAERNRPPASRRVTTASASDARSAEPNSNVLYFDELPPGSLKLMSLEFTLPPEITLPNHPKRAPAASFKRRFLAGVATYCSLGFLMVGPILLSMVLLLVLLNMALSGADDLDSARKTIKSFENYELIIRISLWLWGLWLGLMYLPGKWDGLTYGQRLMRIAPVRKDDDIATLPDTGTLLQRLAGNIMAFFLWVLLWPVALLWLLFGRSRHSLADRLSDCRQIEVGAAPDSPVLKALSPIAYGILLGLAAAVPLLFLSNCTVNTLQEVAAGKTSSSFSEQMLGKEPLDQQKIEATLMARAESKLSPTETLGQLVDMQHQYHTHHQRYSEAIEELFLESSHPQTPKLLALLMQQQQMQRLKMQLTANGFKIGLRRDEGWHIATEQGYEGVQSSF